MALGQVGRRKPMPVVLAVAQIERHHRAVQQADDAPQRTHPDEIAAAAPAHRLRPGEAAQQRRHGARRSGRRPAPRSRRPFPAPSSRLPARNCSRLGAVLAQETRQAPVQARCARAAFGRAAGGDLWRAPRPPARCAAGRRRSRSVGRERARPRRPAAEVGAAPRCMRAGISPTEQFEEQFAPFSERSPTGSARSRMPRDVAGDGMIRSCVLRRGAPARAEGRHAPPSSRGQSLSREPHASSSAMRRSASRRLASHALAAPSPARAPGRYSPARSVTLITPRASSRLNRWLALMHWS